MSLKKFLEEVNATNAMFNRPEVATPVNVAECDALLEQIESHLSPENLCADGERPQSQVKARARMLTAAQKVLNNMKAKFEAAPKEEVKEPVADAPKTEKRMSNAAKVREHIQATYDTQQAALDDFANIVEKAMAFGIKTKPAARQCVTSNIPKVFA